MISQLFFYVLGVIVFTMIGIDLIRRGIGDISLGLYYVRVKKLHKRGWGNLLGTLWVLGSGVGLFAVGISLIVGAFFYVVVELTM